MKLYPPAKINLSLRILGRRADGYHDIETLMTCVTLEDSLDLELVSEEGIVLKCDDFTIPTDNTNLAVVAANAYLKAVALKSGVRIVLEKHIPSRAGLGGGSSDAASVLLGLEALHDGRIGRSGLASLALQIGSDVPFFLGYGAAWCRGRGERCEPANLNGFDRVVILVQPPFPVETRWAYMHWADARKVPGLPYDPQPSPWGDLSNDLEIPVFEKFPFLGLMKRWLLNRPEVDFALMSGSGSTIFAILREDAISETEKLTAAVTSALGDHLRIHICQTRFK